MEDSSEPIENGFRSVATVDECPSMAVMGGLNQFDIEPDSSSYDEAGCAAPSNENISNSTALSNQTNRPSLSQDDYAVLAIQTTTKEVSRPGSATSINKKKGAVQGMTDMSVTAKSKAIKYQPKYDLTGVALEQVFGELGVRMSRLLKKEEFRTEETYDDLEYVKATTRYGKYRCAERLSCLEKLNDLGVVELFNKMYSLYFDNVKFHRVLRDILVVLWNATDSCMNMCQTIIDSGTHKHILQHLNSDRLDVNEKNVGKVYVIKGLLGIINNISRLVENAPAILRDCNAIDILLNFAKSDNPMVRCKVELILAYIMTEQQYEEMDADDKSIIYIIELLRSSMSSPEHHSKKYGFSADEVVQGLNKIAVSDSNKEKILKHGAVEYYVALLQPDCTINENLQAASGIWTLAFKCAEAIKILPGCMDGVKALTEHSDPEVRKQALGALWILEGKDQELSSTSERIPDDEDNNPHIFISYQWASQPTMLTVRDHLIESGYKVWMDVDAMSGSILEAMAMAVEKAAVVIVCMSQKYKESPNCRTEAEYTFRQRKEIVPLRLEYRYAADGWLGALVGNKLYFDFSKPNQVAKALAGLMKELGDRGKTKAAIIRSKSIDGQKSPAIIPARDSGITSAVPCNAVSGWSNVKVLQWIQKMNIGPATEWFSDADGSMLVELKELHRDAPEFYFTTLKTELNLSLKQILLFTKELKKLS